jgi:hypothetical protein
MRLCFYRVDKCASFAEAIKLGAMQEITGLQTEYRTLYEVGGDLADTLHAINVAANMMENKADIRYVLFDDDGEFLDAC